MLVMQLEWAYRTLLNVDCNIQGRLQRGNKISSNVTRNWCTCADEDIVSGGLNDKVGVTIFLRCSGRDCVKARVEPEACSKRSWRIPLAYTGPSSKGIVRPSWPLEYNVILIG